MSYYSEEYQNLLDKVKLLVPTSVISTEEQYIGVTTDIQELMYNSRCCRFYDLDNSWELRTDKENKTFSYCMDGGDTVENYLLKEAGIEDKRSI